MSLYFSKKTLYTCLSLFPASMILKVTKRDLSSVVFHKYIDHEAYANKL